MRLVLLAVLLVGILCSCGAQPTTPDGTKESVGREATSEGTITSGERLAGGERTGPTTEASATGADPERVEGPASKNTATRPAVGTNGMVSSAHPLATRAGLQILEQGETPSMRRWRWRPLSTSSSR